GPETANRNRYINIDPFAQNRIKLVVPTGRNAYINASPIKTTSTKNGQVKNFIATQGPRSDTCAHFWRMLWHETKSPAVIVMLTKLQEGGREKCFQYYPESMANPFLQVNQHDEYNDGLVMTVKLVSITRDPGSWTTIRELELIRRDTNESRKVFHLLFEGWPDFLVPEDQQALCNLVRLSQCKAKDLQNPRIVHCSAGVGRSGTFIALDWLLREFHTKDFAIKDIKDPIRDIVDQLREQRLTMVQSETQLAFLYKTMRGMW
ncbi:receptor/non-receptor type protein-tyrosine phosphatase, partial [Patellaria atrata CBS 101060]